MGSFNEEYLKLRKKRMEEDDEEKSSVPYQRQLNNDPIVDSMKNAVNNTLLINPGQTRFNVAPLRDIEDDTFGLIEYFQQLKDSGFGDGKPKEQKWFEGGAFSDGYQFGDLTKTLLASGADAIEHVGGGLLDIGEAILDGGAFLVGGVADLFGADDFAEDVQDWVAEDLYSGRDILHNLGGDLINEDENSLFGDKFDSLAESGGQLVGTIGLQAVGVPWWVTTGVTSFGGEVENALSQGATYEQAGASGLISAGSEILTEKLFGGSGLGEKGLFNTEVLTKGISNKVVKTLADWGVDMAAEGGEEIASQFISTLGQQLSYEKNATWKELLTNEEAMDAYLSQLGNSLFGKEAMEGYKDAFIGGAALGGIMNVSNMTNSVKNKTDYRTGLTVTEQKVFDKEYNDRIAEAEKDGKLTNKEKAAIYDSVMEDMKKGYISTDAIEEALGGDAYKSYQAEVERENSLLEQENSLKDKIAELIKTPESQFTIGQREELTSLREQLNNLDKTTNKDTLKSQLGEEMFNMLKGERKGAGSFLLESYNEQTRRGQAFETDLSKYDSKQQEVIKKAIESGILNNTNRTHDFVDMVAKISADKGVLFDFANNAKLKDSGFAVDGKFVNGYVTKDGITVNIDSHKALNSIVGHEITHVLEGTELYNALQNAIIEYAKSKGDYQSRIDTLTKLYEGVKDADVNAELTADLVGDYLFTDSDFINHLSTTNRNVFQKIYDEIKYLYKVATAGSKQARELEKVKRAFENVWRESGKVQKNTAEKSGTKYSLSETTDGRFVAVVDSDILSNIDTSSWDKTKKNEAKKAASEALKKFNQGIVVDGITRKVNKISRNEYTRSNYTESLYLNNPDVFADKMRAADVVDDIVVAATNWNRDGALTHSRNDNFVDFDHGQTLIMSGDAKYSAEVIIGITGDGDAVFYDVVDMTPTIFEIKKAESPTAATTQDAIGDIHEDSANGIISQNSEKSIENTKFSLSDSEGKQLTKEQREYFKDSKMRDENGNLKVMYHGSQDAGFHTFDAKMSDDDTSFFFVDRNEVATTYSGTSETYAPKAFKTVEDANKFFAEIDADEYEVVENDGKYTLLDGGDEVATSDDLAEIYEEWRDWSGLGYGDANYKVYLNLTNPLEIDAEGRNWNNISREFSQEVADRYHSLTADEKAALTNLAEWGEYGIFKDEMLAAAKGGSVLASANEDIDVLAKIYEKLGGANANLYDAFSIASENFSEESIKQFAVKQYNTRDYAQKAKAEGYDGVIFKNIHDNGGYSSGDEGASTVAIAFESNQIKSVANDKPTADKDIRYSLSEDSKGRKLSKEQQEFFADSKIRVSEVDGWKNTISPDGALFPVYHGTNSDEFFEFDKDTIGSANDQGWYGKGYYFAFTEGEASYYGNRVMECYLNVKKPFFFSEEMNSYDGQTHGDVMFDFGAFVLNLSDKFPDIAQKTFIEVSDKGDYKDIVKKPFTELAHEIKSIYESDKFQVVEVDEHGETTYQYRHSRDIDSMEAPENIKKLIKDHWINDAWTADWLKEKGTITREEHNEIMDLFEKYDYSQFSDKWVHGKFDSKEYAEKNRLSAVISYLRDYKYGYFGQHMPEYFMDHYVGDSLTTELRNQGYDGILQSRYGDEIVVFDSNQIKLTNNKKPTSSPDIRYSLTEYTAEEKKAHNDMVLEHFGKTYKWAETGYLLLDGTRLDLSGKHDGAPGGYRTVDHRDITEALGYDYGGGYYSGSLIQFMSEGNIRIIPESNGINLSVKPTKAQEQALADFISRYRGEMMLDIDDLNGNTVVSVEYPKGTYYTKILNDIREWFDNGKKPEVASRYPFFSLSDTNEAPTKTYGNYNVYGKDIRLPGADDIAPVGVAENAITTEEADYLTEDYAPIENSYTIEQELDEIQTEIDALVEEGTALYNNGEEEAATRVMLKINELSDKARTLTERANSLKTQEEAEYSAYMDSITDADMPLEAERAYSEAETTPLDEKTLKKLTKGVRDILYAMPKESKAIREVIEKYSTTNQTKSELFKVIKEKFGDKYEYQRYTDIAEVKKHLKNTKFTISDHVKGDIADFSDYKKQHGIRNSKNALSVDVVYEELTELYPGLFPSDIANETDRLERIAEVLATPSREWVKVAELSDNEIMQAVDFIHNEVVGYRNTEARKAAEANARDYIDDIAPSRAREITENVSDPTLRYQGIHRETPIKTVKERIAEKLSNVEKELTDNKRLRADSVVDFNREIARLQEEYNAKVNKNTKAANDILRRIERLQRMKNNVDADYEKRISDLETKKAKLSEETRTGTSATEQAVMRAELHLSKIDNIRAKFAEKGFDFDETLKKAKNLSTFSTVDNTPQRVMEKSLGYREGQILADETVNKVAQNETEGIKWLNSYTDRKNGLIAQISKQYNIKPGSKESAAAQMYAEGFYVNKDNEIIKYGDNELAIDFPDTKVQANIKGLARDTRIRQIYDETLDMINESRARNAYPEIQKLDNYFLHFRAMDDTFSRLGLPFNPNDIRAKDLPTDLNGVTADLKPGQPYFASAKHREGIKTSYDLLGGLERYLSSAKNQIYHIDDIQTLRALRNHIADTYGQAKGLEDLDSLSEAEAQERIKEVFDGHLSTFAKFLHEEANVIAGKTALIDRGLEGVIGRRGMTFMSELNKQVGANMVGFNVSSSLTNFIAPVQAFAKTNKAAFVKGFAQTVSNKIGSIAGKTDGFAENSPVMIRRKGADRFYRTPFQKVGDAGYALMGAVDNISTEIIARAKYNELTAKGMSADQAHVETDKWVSRLMGDRSLGQMPQLYNSKTLGLITKFQLEVRNQLDSQFYDTIQETKANNADIENALARNSKTAAKVALVFTELAIAQHLFGKAFESIAGYNPAFDIIEVLMTALGFDDEESEDTALDNIEQGFLALLEDLPYTSTFTGGRIPISSALPITELIKGEDEYGNEKSRLETLGEIAPYYVLPGGYGQLKKTIQGLGMFSDEHPIAGSYTDSGKLRFPVEDTFLNKAQAAIFGQYASGNARDYFDNDIAPLNEKQTQEFIDVGMTIQDYWKYREGLSKYKTLAEKADYIYGLDLTDDQKNVLINNIADRKEDIDMSDYGNYGSFEEFDFANKYPEKYKFWKQNGISYEDYASGDNDTQAAYNWAYENPDKFTLSKAVASNVVTYRQYTKELYDLKADKDEDGKSITGSRKEKVIDYVNNLDIDYGSRIILFKSEYPADDTYNYDIIDYLNGRDDISYDDMVTILKELGFTVDSKGNIYWD